MVVVDVVIEDHFARVRIEHAAYGVLTIEDDQGDGRVAIFDVCDGRSPERWRGVLEEVEVLLECEQFVGHRCHVGDVEWCVIVGHQPVEVGHCQPVACVIRA